MLRILLSVAGALFIGLGLFGGDLLKGFAGKDASHITVASSNRAEPLVAVEVPASTPVTSTPVLSKPVISTTASISDDQSLTTSAQDAAARVAVVPIAEPQLPVQTAAVITPAVETPVESASVELTLQDTAVAGVPVTDTELAADGAVPIAPAQPAGDLIAMAEQAKASSRNEQVDIASAIVSASNRPVVETAAVAIGKEAEAQSVIVSTTGDLNKDGLIVIKDKVNLRDGPSINHPIVLTLEQGQELMEFKRDGKWVHVGAYGTEGKIGWVHERLVGAVVQ